MRLRRKLISRVSFWFLVMLQVCPAVLSAGSVVFPFRVEPVEAAPYRWLGRGVSYYLTVGLAGAGMDVLPDPGLETVLRNRGIGFPYHMTKATAMELCRELGRDRMVGGEILVNPEEPGKLRLRAYLLDTGGMKQVYLPLLEGRVGELFKVLDALLEEVVCGSGGGVPGEWEPPVLGMDKRGYEFFIKSLLTGEVSRKIELLEKAISAGGDSDRVNMEMALCLLEAGERGQSAEVLGRVRDAGLDEFSRDGKRFLEGVLRMKHDRMFGYNRFREFLAARRFQVEAAHNMGVLCFRDNDYEGAEGHFTFALERRKDPLAYLSLLHVLWKRGKENRAAFYLAEGLRLFPEDDGLIEWFSRLLSRVSGGDREVLARVFRRYVPELEIKKGDVDFDLVARHPLGWERRVEPVKAPGSIMKGAGIDGLDKALGEQPFVSNYYLEIARLYRKRKEINLAEAYRKAGEFLAGFRHVN